MEPGTAEDAEDREFGERFAEALAQDYIARGELDPVGKSRDEVLREAARVWLANPTDIDAGLRLDHEEVLLSEARRYAESPLHGDLAIMMYATWLEHRLNLLLLIGGTARGVSEAAIRDQIKQLSVRNKTGADFTKVFGRDLGNDLAGMIRTIADHRNEFVHYKWPIATMDSISDTRRPLLVMAERAVAELDTFYRRHVLRGFGLDES